MSRMCSNPGDESHPVASRRAHDVDGRRRLRRCKRIGLPWASKTMPNAGASLSSYSVSPISSAGGATCRLCVRELDRARIKETGSAGGVS